jgi:hypothetical protein
MNMRDLDRIRSSSGTALKTALAVSALLFAGMGCGAPKQAAVTPGDEAKPAAEQAVPATPKIEPLKLIYSLKNFFGPRSEADVTFWVEDARSCGGRDAYLGLMTAMMGPDENSRAYAKFTVYADNGEMAITNFVQEDNLAFDDLPAKYNDTNIPLAASAIFAYAGKNFNDEANWGAATPILLKKVDNGRSVSDYSVIRQGETDDASGVAPCRKFKIVEKSGTRSSSYVGCFSRGISKLDLPLVVSMDFGGSGDSTNWKLKSFIGEKSGIAWVPQCLSPVKCIAAKEFSDDEWRACNGQGGQVEPTNDEAGCVTEYKCLTQGEQVERSMSNAQRPGCGFNQAVKNKLLECRRLNKPNFDTTKYDGEGCLADVACR